MTTSNLSPEALSVIDRYLRFRIGEAVCSVPYFNNKTTRSRMTMRTFVGKGSPDDILDETKSLLIKQHLDPSVLTGEALKKLLTESNIGIDCSAFAYYALDAESDHAGMGPLESKLEFVNCTGILGKMRCSLRPAENCDVATFAADANSQVVSLKDAKPGDIITMTGGTDGGERDHILVVHQVDGESDAIVRIHYSHALAYPQDGIYGTGVKQGTIQITSPDKSLTDQLWIEGDTEGDSNPIYIRATKSKTELRRLKWL